MIYKGKELHTGSQYYAAAMDLMRYEAKKECFFGALALFLCGAELNDRFCIVRLKEVLRTPKYLKWVDDDNRRLIMNILAGERMAKEYLRSLGTLRSGVFGVFENKPINHQVAGVFQRRRDGQRA